MPELPSLYENDDYFLNVSMMGALARAYDPEGINAGNPLAWPLAAESADLLYHWLVVMAAAGVPLQAVAEKLVHALEAKRPRPRYYVTTPTYLSGTLRRLLSTRALDWVVARG